MASISKFLHSINAKLALGGKIAHTIPEPPPAPSPNEPAPIVVHKIDFTAFDLPEYAPRYALVIDNLFTPADCARIVAEAESDGRSWQQAVINGATEDQQYLDTSYRNGSRILYDSHRLAGEILEKLRPHLGDIEQTKVNPAQHSPRPTGNMGKLTCLNERLRFLKYGPGGFFKPHCDAKYFRPDGSEASYYTLQLYLSGSKDDLEGGATRFWSSKFWNGENEKRWVDVEPRTGRVLVFEQVGLRHSGEEVKKGTKITMRTDFMYAGIVEEEQDDTVTKE
jgi:hypothetical protein